MSPGWFLLKISLRTTSNHKTSSYRVTRLSCKILFGNWAIMVCFLIEYMFVIPAQSIQDGGGNIISSNYVKYKNSKFVSAKGLVTSFQVRSVIGCAEACQKHVACLTFNIIRHGTYKECQLMAPNDVYMMTSDVNYDHYRPQVCLLF